MARAKTLIVILLLIFLIGSAGLVSVLGQTQDKPKTQTTEMKKGQCTDCKDCKGTCTDCKGNCKDSKGKCTDCKNCKDNCKECKGNGKECKGNCTNGHEKKAGPSMKQQKKK
ncbi:MAG: hypothetical protein V1799_09620 [bacterium]